MFTAESQKDDYRNLSADFRWPNGVKGIAQLNTPLAHVEDEHRGTANPNSTQLLPVGT